MNEFLAKITNLSYEIFGVFLPGIILNLFLLALWLILGPYVSTWTCDLIPALRFSTLISFLASLTSSHQGIGIISLICLWYGMGHIVMWMSRSGEKRGTITTKGRIFRSLLFKIPRPKESYDAELEPLFQLISPRFSTNGNALAWRQFYPVAKIYLSRHLTTSLVTTYQNKYTFHRSIVTASALLFWLSLLSILALCVTAVTPALTQWAGLSFLIIMSISLVWGFSDSYIYHWKMFANTIITETYSLLYSPDHADPKK